jgi:hypothetical protein
MGFAFYFLLDFTAPCSTVGPLRQFKQQELLLLIRGDYVSNAKQSYLHREFHLFFVLAFVIPV